MNIGVLTSTRADYGIYYSLLKALAADEETAFGLFVFGTHLSDEHGRTVTLIERDDYPIYERVDTMPERDDAAGVSWAMGKTMTNFASVWERWAERLDVVIALGDRYEMFAAVAATVSFGIPIGIDFSQPTILVTFHPETVARDKNEAYGKELCRALDRLTDRYQVVVTMPNADTMGSVLRRQYLALGKENDRVIIIESFGKIGYFSAMEFCSFMLGNTSSGIIEAASFKKYAINLGARQDGRAHSDNLITLPVRESSILAAVEKLEQNNLIYTGTNAYLKSGAAATEILSALKRFASDTA